MVVVQLFYFFVLIVDQWRATESFVSSDNFNRLCC